MTIISNSINANSSTPLNTTEGGIGVSAPTAHGVMIAEGASPVTPIVLTAGEVLIGTTAGDPVGATLTAGTGVTITNASGSITIAASGGGGSANPTTFFVDYVNGSDSNNGSIGSPWLTLQHAYTTMHATASYTNPMTIVLSSSQTGASPDSGTITGYPNISITALNGIATISNDITIGGTPTSGDEINLTNLLFNSDFTWTLSTGSILSTLNLNNVTLNGNTAFSNTGTGSAANLNCNNTTFLAGSSNFLLEQGTFTSCQYLGNTTSLTFANGVNTGAGVSTLTFIGGVSTALLQLDITVIGSASVYVQGMMGGFNVTGTAAGGHTPALFIDDCSGNSYASYPGMTVTYQGNAQQINSDYTPVHYTASATDVRSNLAGIDSALGGVSNGAVATNVQTFGVSGTYTPHANMIFSFVEVQGAGGGGGYCNAGDVWSQGGAAGGYGSAYLTATQIGSSKTITIGGGGNGATSPSTSGSQGGTTSIGTLISCSGGLGGQASVSTSPDYSAVNGGTATPGSGVTLVKSLDGATNYPVGQVQTPIIIAPNGGAGYIFGGGWFYPNICNSSSGQSAGSTPSGSSEGSGGSGGCSGTAGSGADGGGGSPGFVVITEYLS